MSMASVIPARGPDVIEASDGFCAITAFDFSRKGCRTFAISMSGLSCKRISWSPTCNTVGPALGFSSDTHSVVVGLEGLLAVPALERQELHSYGRASTHQMASQHVRWPAIREHLR